LTKRVAERPVDVVGDLEGEQVGERPLAEQFDANDRVRSWETRGEKIWG